ncbi:MAG: LysR family transcriptional regulator, partial [Kiritimatiellae bacterium]|nr:LysR family transcriptional regulator [Kiritimatiellia bacterium]
MQIESLKVYCDVVRHRSFSQAAQLNGITQSAVSQIVSHIEKRLGLCLIDRSTRPLRPTD